MKDTGFFYKLPSEDEMNKHPKYDFVKKLITDMPVIDIENYLIDDWNERKEKLDE